jgi:hypothetical protein
MPKLGYFSPSQFKILMTSAPKWSKTSENYLVQLALERVGMLGREEKHFKATDHGITYEAMGLAYYQQSQVLEVHSSQIQLLHDDLKIAGHPDGLVGDEGGVDIKCPANYVNHGHNILFNAQLKDYEPQLQGYMLLTGRKWWDLASFCPDAPEPLKLHVIRVERDQAYIDSLLERVREAEAKIKPYTDTLIAKIKAYNE